MEIVIKAGEVVPEGHVDLNAPDVFAFYNAQSADVLSLSMRCAVSVIVICCLPARYENRYHVWIKWMR